MGAVNNGSELDQVCLHGTFLGQFDVSIRSIWSKFLAELVLERPCVNISSVYNHLQWIFLHGVVMSK